MSTSYSFNPFTGNLDALSLVTIGTANGLSITSDQVLSIDLSSASTTGALSSTDWNTFNNKQAAGSYITSLTGGVTASGPGAATATVVTNANLTGPITSVGNATSVASQTGTGSTFVMNTSPTLITPNIGAATASSLTDTSLSAGSVLLTGSGGLITEDSTNFIWDATNHRLRLNGHTGTGTIALTTTGTDIGIDIKSTATNTAFNVQNQGAQYVAQFTNATNSAVVGATIGGAFSRGDLTAKTAVQAGDIVTNFNGQSYNGTSYGPGYNAAIVIAASENQTSTHNGGLISLATTPNGALAPLSALILGQNQLMQLPAYTTSGFLSNDASGNVTTKTATQTTAALNLFSSSLQGLTPSSGGGTTNFLRADGTWASPSGSTLTAPKVTTYTSGSGTFTKTGTPLYIRVRMVGGGGGGGGGGTSGGAGGAGGNTTFGTTLLVANGGSGGSLGGGGAAGGTASLGTGPVGSIFTGGSGGAGINDSAAVSLGGGWGGASMFGGCGATTVGGTAVAGGAYGSGGAGGGAVNTISGGSGGGAGGGLDAIISSPSATYSYAVGSAGTATTGNVNSGAVGQSGYIEVTEYYQ